MADQVPKLGGLIEGPETRDAIHIAVAPVIADERLLPGQRVKLANSRDNEHVIAAATKAVGIIDPYLISPVEKDEKCWMFLMPNSIVGLRHNWDHPAFHTETTEREQAESWLRWYALSINRKYDSLMRGAFEYLEKDEHFDVPLNEAVHDKFWDKFEIVTGCKRPDDKDPDFFSCCGYDDDVMEAPSGP